jgi:hypothetical protein
VRGWVRPGREQGAGHQQDRQKRHEAEERPRYLSEGVIGPTPPFWPHAAIRRVRCVRYAQTGGAWMGQNVAEAALCPCPFPSNPRVCVRACKYIIARARVCVRALAHVKIYLLLPHCGEG